MSREIIPEERKAIRAEREALEYLAGSDNPTAEIAEKLLSFT